MKRKKGSERQWYWWENLFETPEPGGGYMDYIQVIGAASQCTLIKENHLIVRLS
jgi:hypothetical protein